MEKMNISREGLQTMMCGPFSADRILLKFRAAGTEAVLEPEVARVWIGDCRQPASRPLKFEFIIKDLLTTKSKKPLKYNCHV
jgi:myo-inositol catabolism protein IolC